MRLLFTSYHGYLDPSSGAAVSVRDLFRLLTRRGWECQVFCGPRLDYEVPTSLDELLRYLHIPFQKRTGKGHGLDFVLYNTVVEGIPVALYETPAVGAGPGMTEAQENLHLGLVEAVLEQARPDVMLTYGGLGGAQRVMAWGRRRGIAVAFWLCNLAYDHRPFFAHTDGILVPSAFSADHYRETVGLDCTALPPPVDWDRVRCEGERTFLTFINPTPSKGLYLFAAIARELARRRPDLPVLVVEGRGRAVELQRTGVDLSALTNLKGMTNTPDPRQFYSRTRVLLVPSLCGDTAPRVVPEAMLNGIPVLASRRGGLPEVVGEAGFVFDVPGRYTPDTRAVPTAEEAAPWVETILRLWDDPAFFKQAAERARAEAEKWHPDRLGERYAAYLTGLAEARGSGG